LGVALPRAEGTLTRLTREVFAVDESRASSWDAALFPGAVVGRFELLREVGRGGFGTVWEARDTELKRLVAFKAIRGSARTVADERALAEAEAVAQLSHPNVVTLFDIGRCEHGTYLVMELLTGMPIRELLRDGPLPPDEVARIGLQVARGLVHAHQKGILHRDLTAANVFVCDDGAVKLLDLGLSRILAGAGSPVGREGGTPGYMPPERLRGESEDARSDLYGLGALLFMMGTGEKPGTGEGAGSIAAGLRGPDPLAALVARLLEGDPASRPSSALEVQRELERIGAPTRGEASTTSAPPREPARRRGPLVLRATVVVAVLLVAASAAAALVRSGRLASAGSGGAVVVSVARSVLAVGETTVASAASIGAVGESVLVHSPSWMTSDPRVATVDARGKVTGRGIGTATLTAADRGADGSTSVVVSGPEWQLVSESSLAPPPAGSFDQEMGAKAGQGVARVHGRRAWHQTAPFASLLVPFALPEDADAFAVQADVHLPSEGQEEREVAIVPFASRSVVEGTALLTLQGPDRWRTLRVEGSQAQCRFRVFLDGVLVSESAGRCGLDGRFIKLTSVNERDAPVDAAWSNLRVFRGTPVGGMTIALHRLPPGSDAYAKALVTPIDASGNTLPGRTIRWESSEPGVATVDASGTVLARGPGEATITARCEGKVASARLQVGPIRAAAP
jgi:hypothetical protein